MPNYGGEKLLKIVNDAKLLRGNCLIRNATIWIYGEGISVAC
jgi:hypothetical protein